MHAEPVFVCRIEVLLAQDYVGRLGGSPANLDEDGVIDRSCTGNGRSFSDGD